MDLHPSSDDRPGPLFAVWKNLFAGVLIVAIGLTKGWGIILVPVLLVVGLAALAFASWRVARASPKEYRRRFWLSGIQTAALLLFWLLMPAWGDAPYHEPTAGEKAQDAACGASFLAFAGATIALFF